MWRSRVVLVAEDYARCACNLHAILLELIRRGDAAHKQEHQSILLTPLLCIRLIMIEAGADNGFGHSF